MSATNAYNGASQLSITKFINANVSDETNNISLVGEGNMYNVEDSNSAYLPTEDYYNILPGAIIIVNSKTRYVM